VRAADHRGADAGCRGVAQRGLETVVAHREHGKVRRLREGREAGVARDAVDFIVAGIDRVDGASEPAASDGVQHVEADRVRSGAGTHEGDPFRCKKVLQCVGHGMGSVNGRWWSAMPALMAEKQMQPQITQTTQMRVAGNPITRRGSLHLRCLRYLRFRFFLPATGKNFFNLLLRFTLNFDMPMTLDVCYDYQSR
jgi:hypothetical protein